MDTEQSLQRGVLLAFRASPDLVRRVEAAAAKEGISRSDVCRRATLRDLARGDEGEPNGRSAA